MRYMKLLLFGITSWFALGAMIAHGSLYFADDFNGPAFNSNLVDIDGSYVFADGKARNAFARRSYVRTVESNYRSVDFRADLIYSISGSGGAPGVFFGIGPATKDGGFFNEPDAALYLLDHTNGFPSWPASNMVVRRNAPGNGNFTDLYNTPFPDGTAYARITKIGDFMTLAFDYQYNGLSFVPDGSFTLNLSTVAPFLATGPSYLFFGTGFSDAVSPSRLDSIQVTAIPEPTPVLFWSVLCALVVCVVGLRNWVNQPL